jgi:hypothetical protein
LEAVPDLRPLPPEPYEEGLEFLPAAEDERSVLSSLEGGVGGKEGFGTGSSPDDHPYLQGLEELSDVEELSEAEELTLVETSVDEFSGTASDVRDEKQKFAELETVDESLGAEEKEEGVLSLEDRQSALSRLMASGAIKSWTLGEMQRLVEESKSAIVMEDGVFRIKEEVYGVGGSGGQHASTPHDSNRSGELRDIAQEVVAHASQPQDSEGTFSGIGDLFSDAEVFEVPPEVSKRSSSNEEALEGEQERTRPVKFADGIDYDDFLSFYPRSAVHTQQMRSLVEISRRVSAVSAALMAKSPSGFSLELTVGLNEKSRQKLHLESDNPLNKLFLKQRKAIAVEKNPSDLDIWQVFIDREDLRYMKRVLLIPAHFRSQEAYLLLAFASDQEIGLKDIFSKLLVR